ncbi:MAG: hypothetical protein IT176_06035 [Acidobacteria bacterium]|nr:hypothetical protein [Acidobacteriota bacterium]
MRRPVHSSAAAAAVLLVLGVLAPPAASAQQSVNFSVGGFVPRGLDGRPNTDVLVNNLDFLIFDLKDFNGASLNAEWLIGLGDFVEAGLGAGWYAKTSPAIYRRFTHADGSEIEQDLKLRIVPFSATLRILPLGRRGVQPYLGIGAGVLRYRYSETGDFVDLTDRSIFRDNFVATGTATGPLILGGVRFRIEEIDLGFEMRHQAGKGELPEDLDFSGSRIDLGGMNYLFTLNVHF